MMRLRFTLVSCHATLRYKLSMPTLIGTKSVVIFTSTRLPLALMLH